MSADKAMRRSHDRPDIPETRGITVSLGSPGYFFLFPFKFPPAMSNLSTLLTTPGRTAGHSVSEATAAAPASPQLPHQPALPAHSCRTSQPTAAAPASPTSPQLPHQPALPALWQCRSTVFTFHTNVNEREKLTQEMFETRNVVLRVNFRSRDSGRSGLCVSPKKLNY